MRKKKMCLRDQDRKACLKFLLYFPLYGVTQLTSYNSLLHLCKLVCFSFIPFYFFEATIQTVSSKYFWLSYALSPEATKLQTQSALDGLMQYHLRPLNFRSLMLFKTIHPHSCWQSNALWNYRPAVLLTDWSTITCSHRTVDLQCCLQPDYRLMPLSYRPFSAVDCLMHCHLRP